MESSAAGAPHSSVASTRESSDDARIAATVDAVAAESQLMRGSPYVGYSYSYPHKTAYRTLEPARPLRELWADQRRDSLFLYLHVPFCEVRCGFCNLFTLAQPEQSLPRRYLQQMRREAERVSEALGEWRFVRLAIGGGTPTFLTVDELAELCAIADDVLGVHPGRDALPASIEASPATVDAEKLALLRQFGIERVSLGVQAFDEQETRELGRPQRVEDVTRAVRAIRDAGFPTLNLDLIYGGEGQTPDGWRRTIARALEFTPEEIYLYPLYVRPLTGLARLTASDRGDETSDSAAPLDVADDAAGRAWDERRLAAYRAGRDQLLAAGYEQTSMRMFRKPTSTATAGPAYCCQTDGMIGLGCGARSYTTRVHYSTEFAVGKPNVRSILTDYVERDPTSFEAARHGFELDADDQRRRFVILSLLQADGLSDAEYRSRFHATPLVDLPCLAQLIELGLATSLDGRLTLTAAGLERSDAIGPWLYSSQVRLRMEAHRCR